MQNKARNKLILTEFGLGSEVIRGLRWLTLAGLVDSLDTELISFTLSQVLHLELRLVALGVAMLHPLGGEFVLALNDVAGDGGAAVIVWSLPLQLTPRPVIVLHLRLAGLARGICGGGGKK